MRDANGGVARGHDGPAARRKAMPKQFSSRKAQRAASDPQSDRVFQQNWPRAVAQPDGRTADPTAALLGTAAIRSVPVRSGQNTARRRSEAQTSELQSLMRTSYAVFCLK